MGDIADIRRDLITIELSPITEDNPPPKNLLTILDDVSGFSTQSEAHKKVLQDILHRLDRHLVSIGRILEEGRPMDAVALSHVPRLITCVAAILLVAEGSLDGNVA